MQFKTNYRDIKLAEEKANILHKAIKKLNNKQYKKGNYMFDIDFYMKVSDLNQEIIHGYKKNKKYLYDKLEEFRSKNPFVYNIETTNACNMKCKMCPRTTMMTRPIKTLDKDKQYLLKQMYSITEAESPGDMYDIAVESLKHFKLKEAPQNEH